MATSVAASPLFKLPAELRLRIYEYALKNEKGTNRISWAEDFCEIARDNGIPEPALLFTCKAVREEAVQTYYTVNRFCVIAKDCHPAAHVLMARKKVFLQTMGLDVTKIAVEYRTTGLKNFQNLLLWLRYLHQGEKIGHCSQAARKSGSTHEKIIMAIRFMASLTQIAEDMSGRPWADVEKIITGLRSGLIAMDEQWKVDA